jgi:hypothetical protein
METAGIEVVSPEGVVIGLLPRDRMLRQNKYVPEQMEKFISFLWKRDVTHVVQELKPCSAAYHPCFRLQTENGPPRTPLFLPL